MDALELTCTYLRDTCRDAEMLRLRKQKHAAHNTCCRLRKKLRSLELTHRLLMAMLASSERHRRDIQQSVASQIQQELNDLPSLGV